jgi:thiol-disulfide isomerase/thioredoxin
VVFGLERGLSALAGPRPVYVTIADGAAAVAVAALVWRAVRVARARPAAKPAAADGPAAPAPDPAPPVSTPAPARVAAAAVGALVLALAAHGAAWSARNIEALRPISRGQSAPDFSLARVDGTPGAVALSGLRGQVVVLDFWATWCPPCIQMIPVMDGLAGAWGPRGVSFVGINSDAGATDDVIREFLGAHPFTYPVVRDGDGQVGERYRVEALPTIVIVGRDGSVRSSFVGYTMKGTLDKALRDAVEAAAR